MKKQKDMKPQTTYHEIMLFTGTRFASREFSSREENKHSSGSASEELEKACWAGMLCELIPEIAGEPNVKSENFIWNIVNGKNFLYITMGPHPQVHDNATTIDPYFMIMRDCEN
jgi:hypothetical protein